MKRSLILFLSTLSLTTAVLASPFDGFYAGVAGGGSRMEADTNSAASAGYVGFNTLSPAFINTISNSQSADVIRNSVIGDLYAGWGHQLAEGPFYVADELFANISNREAENTNFAEWIDLADPMQTNLKTTATAKLNQTEFGNDVLAGIVFGQDKTSLFYTRVGVAFNQLRLSTANTLSVTDFAGGSNPPLATVASLLPGQTNKSVVGVRAGIGFAKRFARRLALHIDYIYTDYGKINTASTGNTNSPDVDVSNGSSVVTNGFTSSASSDVHTQAIMLGASYYFTPFNPLAILSPVVTTAANADVYANFSGFHVGTSVGATQTMADFNSLTTGTYLDNATPGSTTGILKNSLTSDDLRDNQAMGSIDIGYGIQRRPLYIAAEIFSNFGGQPEISATHQVNHIDTAFMNTVNLATAAKVQLNTAEYGIDVLPGLLVGQNMLIYGRAGIAFNKIEINHSNTFTFVANGLTPAVTKISTLNTASSKNIDGFRLGVGVAEKINSHVALHADYIYTDYGRVDTSGIASTTSVNVAGATQVVSNGLISNASADISSQALMAGVNYYFSPRLAT
jgi:opacity protein-like surface antigen